MEISKKRFDQLCENVDGENKYLQQGCADGASFTDLMMKVSEDVYMPIAGSVICDGEVSYWED